MASQMFAAISAEIRAGEKTLQAREALRSAYEEQELLSSEEHEYLQEILDESN